MMNYVDGKLPKKRRKTQKGRRGKELSVRGREILERNISGGMVSYLVNDTRSKLEKETCKYVGNEDVFEQMMKINERKGARDP